METPFITDHMTLRGHSAAHLEHGCQDFSFENTALAGELQLALVSDGCSGSPNSDFGARLLVGQAVHTLQDMMRMLGGQKVPDNEIDFCNDFTFELQTRLCHLDGALDYGGPFGLGYLDATLVTAIRYKHGVFVFMHGDGCVFVEYMDGTKKLIRRDTNAQVDGKVLSAPSYLTYDLPRARCFRDKYLESKPITTQTVWTKDEAWSEPHVVDSAEVGCPWSMMLPYAELRSVVVSSDGLGSFYGPGCPSLPQLADELFAYNPAVTGRALRRRLMYKSLSSWPKAGLKHHDDLGVAGLLRK